MSAVDDPSVNDNLHVDPQQHSQLHLGGNDHHAQMGQPQSQQQPSMTIVPPQQGDISGRKAKAPSVRRACVACHQGKTRCSEVLPCQSCLKRGIGATCAYPEPEAHQAEQNAAPPPPPFTPQMYAATTGLATAPNLSHHQYYDYNGAFTGASTSTFRPNKRPRNLTDEEAAAITRNFSRGDFYVGNSAPVRIDPRLPVRLTLGEGDHVHFTVGEVLV